MKQILISLLFLLALSSCKKDNSEAIKQIGYIEGNVEYPGMGMPGDMKVYAINISNNQIYEIDLHEIDDPSKYIDYQQPFKFELEVGTYFLYAMTNHQSYQNYKAYYSEFVTCGMSVDCTSHEPIPVTIKNGETISDILVADWYK